ncbi:MAG: hypothetical protein AAB459_03615 [Patescibacteria group bacterium]
MNAGTLTENGQQVARYYRDINHYVHARYWRRIKKVLAVVLVVGLAVVSILVIDILRTKKKNNTPSESTPETTATYNPSVKIHRTAYFQFQTDQSWSFIKNESTDNKFVFRSLRGKLVEHGIMIFVNQKISPEASRVLPAELKTDQSLVAGFVSDHCQKSLPKNAAQLSQTANIQGAEFTCDYDSSEYSVVVGLRGAKVPFELVRPDGTKITYAILYHNLRAVWDDAQLRQIVDSFQTR